MIKSFPEDFYDVLFHYRKGLSRVAKNNNIGHGLIVYLVVNLVASLSTVNIAPQAEEMMQDLPAELAPMLPLEVMEAVALTLPILAILLQLVFGPLLFLLGVAVLNFIATLFGGTGSALKLGAVLGYAQLPYLVVALGGLISRFAAVDLIGLFTLAAFVWSLLLKIYGIKVVHGFSSARAAIVYFMPVIALGVAFILFLLLAIVFIIPVLMQALEGLSGVVPIQ